MTNGVGVVLVMALSALGACSGGSDDVDYARACGLLSDDEAAAVLGTDVHQGEPDFDRTIPESFCIWIAQGSSTAEGDDTYGVFVSEGAERFSRREFDRDRRDSDATEVDDLGDAAYFHNPGDLPFLTLRVGDHVATIGVASDDEHPVGVAEAKKMEREIARTIVSRL